MEMILTLAVVIAVIIFGALISVGNDRQRRAIDALREQVVLWAMQDLGIKREKLARDVQVNDPIRWLNNITAKVCGSGLNLRVIEMFDEPQALVCEAREGTSKIVFTPLSPIDLHDIKRSKRNRLIQFTNNNPLLSLPRGVKFYEISVLNGGILFDLELPLAWMGLTGQRMESINRLWMFEYS